MLDMRSLLEMQGQFFLLVLLGVFFRRKLVGAEFQRDLSRVIVDLLLPCNIIAGFQIEFTRDMIAQAGSVFLISLGGQLLAMLLARFAFNHAAPDRKSVMQSAVMVSNAGFLGMPVAEGIWGPEGVLFASIFLLPVRVFMWTVGVTYFCREKGRDLVKKLATNPCILATLLGIVLLAGQWKLPGVLSATVNSLSRSVTAMSMFMIGMNIAFLRWQNFLDPQVLGVSALRLLIQPAIVLLACKLLGIGSVVVSVAVILTAMPAGASVAILATRYRCAEAFAADVVTVSTLLSLITIPLWALLLL